METRRRHGERRRTESRLERAHMSSAYMSWKRIASVFWRSFSLPIIGLAFLGHSCSSTSNGKSGAPDSGAGDSTLP